MVIENQQIYDIMILQETETQLQLLTDIVKIAYVEDEIQQSACFPIDNHEQLNEQSSLEDETEAWSEGLGFRV